jgi:RNA polymerase sigma-70 factor (ECF subfamily)
MVVNAQLLPTESIDLTSPEAFGVFYMEALPRIYGYFFSRLGGDTFVAEDLTQETFLAATREIAGGAVVEAPLPWIVGIARHKLLDHFRRNRAAEVVVQMPNVTGDELPEWPALPIDIGNEERVLDALRAVPSPQRDALILHFMDDLPVAEVARLMGRTRSSAESLIWRGRVAFRKHYLEAGDERRA